MWVQNINFATHVPKRHLVKVLEVLVVHDRVERLAPRRPRDTASRGDGAETEVVVRCGFRHLRLHAAQEV